VETTIVVVAYNSADVLPGCLDALPAASEGIGPLRVVVVDNDSRDDTAAVARQHPQVWRVLPMGRNAGYAAAINAGVRAAGVGGPVVVLNPDVRLAPGSLRRLLEALERDGAGVAVPRLVDESGRLALSLRREPTVLRAFGEALLGGRRAGRVAALGEVVSREEVYAAPAWADWATGAAMVISRECWRAAGPWDESFFLYSEETDFALRARDAGYRLRYVPDAEAVHIGGESGSSPYLWTILTCNKVRLYDRRHRAPLSRLAFRAAVLLGELLRTPRSATHRAAARALLIPAQRPAQVRGALPPAPVEAASRQSSS